MTESNDTFDENLELAKSLTASVWKRLENLGVAKGGPGSGPHASGGSNDGGTHEAWVKGGAKGNSPATQSIKDSVARNPGNDNLKSALANSKAGDQSARSGDHAAARESYQAASDSHMGAEAGSSFTISPAGSEHAQEAADYHSGQDNSYPKDWQTKSLMTKSNNTFDEKQEGTTDRLQEAIDWLASMKADSKRVTDAIPKAKQENEEADDAQSIEDAANQDVEIEGEDD